MSKINNPKSRAAAVALAVVGVAGLSMAAAAQLNLTFTGTFQAGAATIAADCQGDTPVTVAFSTPSFDANGATPWKVATVNFGAIETACNTKTFKTAYKTSAAGPWIPIATPTGTGTVTAPSLAVTLPTDVDSQTIVGVALTIHS